MATHSSGVVKMLLLLLLLSRFSRVRLCATPQTAAHQAPLSLEFSRQGHWSELPFPSPTWAICLHINYNNPLILLSLEILPKAR